MSFKLIATDMDDTLLNSNHVISDENRNAIIDIQKRGVTFSLASGRPTFAMHSFAEELELSNHGGFILGYNGGEIIDAKTGNVVFASLDHDLSIRAAIGQKPPFEKTGYDVVCWMEQNNVWPIHGVAVHSMNPVGKERMLQVIDRHYTIKLVK